jgi:hypothetical protein
MSQPGRLRPSEANPPSLNRALREMGKENGEWWVNGIDFKFIIQYPYHHDKFHPPS